jgi:hypothetical protein
MTNIATKAYLVGVIERAIAYYKVEAEDARTAAENWQEGEFWDRNDEALEAEGPCDVREQQPDGTFVVLPSTSRTFVCLLPVRSVGETRPAFFHRRRLTRT